MNVQDPFDVNFNTARCVQQNMLSLFREELHGFISCPGHAGKSAGSPWGLQLALALNTRPLPRNKGVEHRLHIPITGCPPERSQEITTPGFPQNYIAMCLWLCAFLTEFGLAITPLHSHHPLTVKYGDPHQTEKMMGKLIRTKNPKR